MLDTVHALKPKHADRKACKVMKLPFVDRKLVKVVVPSHKLSYKN